MSFGSFAWLAFGLSIVGFLLFAFCLCLEATRVPREPSSAGKAAVSAASAVDPVAALETFVKLIEGLNKSSPVVLALASSLLFFALGLASAYLEKPVPAVETSKARTVAATSCRVGPFEEGVATLKKPLDECLERIVRTSLDALPLTVTIVGRFDLREESRPGESFFRTRPEIAHRRALAVREYLIDRRRVLAPAGSGHAADGAVTFANRLVVAAGGPMEMEPPPSRAELAGGQLVDVRAVWPDPKAPGRSDVKSAPSTAPSATPGPSPSS
jgi:hypothetical protein